MGTNPNIQLNELLSIQGIRTECYKILEKARENKLRNFSINENNLSKLAQLVINVTKENYPNLNIPYHSRWRHFYINNFNLWQELQQNLANNGVETDEWVRIAIDLVVISVLLDSGAGDEWNYTIPNSQINLGRSEGIAITSFYMFIGGTFAQNHEFHVGAERLEEIQQIEIEQGLQISENNPIPGISGRTKIINNLGICLRKHPEIFGQENQRIGNIR